MKIHRNPGLNESGEPLMKCGVSSGKWSETGLKAVREGHTYLASHVGVE